MTPFAFAAAHPFLSSALILAAGFAAGYLVVGPAFLRPAPVPAPPPLLPSAVPSHGHPAPSPLRHHRSPGVPDPRVGGPGAPAVPVSVPPSVEPVADVAASLADDPGPGVLEPRAAAKPEPEHACPVARGVGLAYRKRVSVNDYEPAVREYLRYCKRAAAELRLQGSRLEPKYHPTEVGCLRLVFHRTPAEAEQIREAFREVTTPASKTTSDDKETHR